MEAEPYRAVMYGARQRPSHLICGLCPSITDTTFALQFPHMLIIHAVLEHNVNLEDVAQPRRVVAPRERLYGGYRTRENWRCCGR